MKIAVIGTGIAGNVAAHYLAREHELTVFEADNRIGGHTHTVDVTFSGQSYAVDTGFIVYNDRTYPNFIKLLDELGVATQLSDMSFSVSNQRSGLEYNGASLNAMFAQRSNLLRPQFYRMIRDILRFNREAHTLLESRNAGVTLGQFLQSRRFSKPFIDDYILPMGAAIWSAVPEQMQQMPGRFFAQFFANHGLLTVNDHPQWRVIAGGSRNYVEKLVAGHRESIRLNAPVECIRRMPGHVEIKARGGEFEHFDHVFIATHSDQALAMIDQPSADEAAVLGAIKYQNNEVVLHTDSAQLPRRSRAWAAWNYRVPEQPARRVILTYNMNILQSLVTPQPVLVTLNNTSGIDPAQIIGQWEYSHPVFDPAAVAAQGRHAEINGAKRTWYCGAYWRYGFHEDGVVSALDTIRQFDEWRRNEERDFRRAG
jgi:predicted NAD/FAD-binding protein